MKKKFCALTALLLMCFLLFSCTDDGKAGVGGSVNNGNDGTDIIPDTSEPTVGSMPEGGSPPTAGSPVINATVGDEISIVVLGDSIASGYGLNNAEENRFSALLAESLRGDFARVSVANYAADGMTGSELADFLEGQMPEEIADCDYVIISIGGNNVLDGLADSLGLSELAAGLGSDLIDGYQKYITASDGSEKENYAYALDAINSLLRRVNNGFSDGGLADLSKASAEKLRAELPAVIGALKNENPSARIIVQTVYNPYNGIVIALPYIEETVPLAAYGETAVSGMNEVIEELSREQGFTVAPIWREFADSEKKPINAAWSFLPFGFSLDPHPNSDGHALMADVYYKIIKENSQ